MSVILRFYHFWMKAVQFVVRKQSLQLAHNIMDFCPYRRMDTYKHKPRALPWAM